MFAESITLDPYPGSGYVFDSCKRMQTIFNLNADPGSDSGK